MNVLPTVSDLKSGTGHIMLPFIQGLPTENLCQAHGKICGLTFPYITHIIYNLLYVRAGIGNDILQLSDILDFEGI